MPLIRDITTGDRIQLGAVFGIVDLVVHYGGAFDVRIALRDTAGKRHWVGANYTDSCRRLRGPQRGAKVEAVRSYASRYDLTF